MKQVLDSIELPSGLRSLTTEQLETLSAELRHELIETVAVSGGHFASSLGATELTVVLHHLFDTPEDRLIWDVGHQGYIHKMLTGRREQMPGIRTKGGISGFLKRCESPYDVFGAGHAGTSVSAAVGVRVGLAAERFVVAVIGDGSLTAGMAFEALNHAGSLGLKNFIVVLNDNDMSISPNVGALSWLFSKTVTSPASTWARSGFKELHRRGYVPELVYKVIDRAEEVTQGFFATPAMLFEAFGFRYIGPVDGHSVPDLLTAMKNAKEQDIPVLVHVRTKKGRGYDPAEEDPVKWHGVSPFNPERGEFLPSSGKRPPTYTAVFADTMIELAKRDPKLVAITAAMPGGTGLDKFQAAHPSQFFDVGICEQHAVTFAAGLATQGYTPVCAIYSTFLQRAFDQVVHDVCIQQLPVVFAIDRAGAVGNDGETHQGAFDIAYLRAIPDIVVMSPMDENELQHMLFTATSHRGPSAVRYPRGNGTGVAMDEELRELPLGKGQIVRKGEDILLIGFGPVVGQCLEVAEKLEKRTGLTCTVINARFAKPLDQELLAAEIPTHRLVCTVEDHALIGGFSSAVLELVNDFRIELAQPILRFGMQDAFLPHGSQAEQFVMNGYDSDQILEQLLDILVPRRQAVAG